MPSIVSRRSHHPGSLELLHDPFSFRVSTAAQRASIQQPQKAHFFRLGGVYWLPSPKSGLYPPSPPPFLKAGGMPARAFPAPGPVVVFLSSRAFWNMTVKPSDVAGFFTSHSPNLGSGCPCPLLSGVAMAGREGAS
uniref:Uncharacterized protein n=1 Tax=Zea mays TaxID=4577 RepID=C4J7B3_MAIZE|nr:unknown [Zea mays]ACR37516.1 unknown [Zea mays]